MIPFQQTFPSVNPSQQHNNMDPMNAEWSDNRSLNYLNHFQTRLELEAGMGRGNIQGISERMEYPRDIRVKGISKGYQSGGNIQGISERREYPRDIGTNGISKGYRSEWNIQGISK